jgi:hypothetical protein
MPEEQDEAIRELRRDHEIVELFKKLSGADPLPSRWSKRTRIYGLSRDPPIKPAHRRHPTKLCRQIEYSDALSAKQELNSKTADAAWRAILPRPRLRSTERC